MNRTIREDRKWRLTPRTAARIRWRTSEKGNKWFSHNGRHVIVFPSQTPGPVRYFYSLNGDRQIGEWSSENDACQAALVALGLAKSTSDSGQTTTISGHLESQERADNHLASIRRRIKD